MSIPIEISNGKSLGKLSIQGEYSRLSKAARSGSAEAKAELDAFKERNASALRRGRRRARRAR